jgi:hypothetical protein
LQLKSEMRLATMAVWIFVAVSCAALPFLHAIPVACIALSAVTRQVLGAEPPSPDLWATLTPIAAAAFGLASWGVPVGLLFTVDNFLRSKSFSVLVSSAVIWPLAGIGFGLVMRWMSQRGKKKSQA